MKRMCLLSVVDTCPTIDFWMEKLMEVPSPSFSKTHVPSVIRIEAHETKNKDFKPHVLISYLTFFYFCNLSPMF
jgi:hypothetical protein